MKLLSNVDISFHLLIHQQFHHQQQFQGVKADNKLLIGQNRATLMFALRNICNIPTNKSELNISKNEIQMKTDEMFDKILKEMNLNLMFYGHTGIGRLIELYNLK